MNLVSEYFTRIVGDNAVLQALSGGVIIAFLNLLGALAVLLWRNPSERGLNAALGFAAGSCPPPASPA